MAIPSPLAVVAPGCWKIDSERARLVREMGEPYDSFVHCIGAGDDRLEHRGAGEAARKGPSARAAAPRGLRPAIGPAGDVFPRFQAIKLAKFDRSKRGEAVYDRSNDDDSF